MVFAKAPVAGYAKKRLIPALGAEKAAILQERLIRHTLETATRTGCPVELWCAPDSTHPFLVQCAIDYSVRLRQQDGRDLGERMHHAFADALNRYPCAVLVGCDCPELSTSMLSSVFNMLDKDHEPVIGPVEDGGYCLIGLCTPEPAVFTEIPWGTGAVLECTRNSMRSLKWHWKELPCLWDVDRPEDLLRLKQSENCSKILLDIIL